MEEELQNMKKWMDVLNNAVKGKGQRNLDRMVKQTESPFIAAVLDLPLPQKFRLPQLDSFDSLKDLLENIESFKSLMNLQKTPDKIMCRAFLTTLKGPARVWFSKIPPSTIGSFN